MNRPPSDLPPRLLEGEATDFERRVLDSALEKRPSAAASARMAKALGVTVTTVGTAAAAKALAAQATSKATAAAAASTSWPWISAGVLGLLVAGTVVGVRALHVAPPALAPVSSTPNAPAVSEPATPTPVQPVAEAATTALAKPLHHGHTTPTGSDLRNQITILDAARAAVAGGDGSRALEILGGYDAKYPAGSFRPEGTAIRIEALVKLGRQSEARALAAKLVAEQRGTLLAKRVAEMVGLTESATSP
jgi:hypothetical protein